MLISFDRRLHGLRRKAVQIGDHRVVYSEGGKDNAEPVVLVHGFSASADTWNRMAAQLTKRYHVVAPDLPGWGESTRLDSASYGYTAQLQRLHDFLQQLGMRRFHLVGHSMGGCLSAGYAARYPDEVITLALIAPHGVTEPQQSELAACVARGDNWLIVSSPEGYERLMNNLFVQRPYIPRAVLEYMAQQTVRRSAKTQRIFDEIQAINPPLLERLGQINVPTLIVWGDDDKLIHVSAAEVFRNAIGNSEVLIMSKTGHMPLLENVKQCGSAYAAFLDKQRRSSHAVA
ncbi:MAG TPA: alpha/beta fold hydrolase [Candidatus Acidoferrales bacterium]|nr:alpha/beta fold hydrolase [Candidatus Acidoferrales bacterium]